MIFIEDEFISKIIQSSQSLSELQAEYPHYTWYDYTNYYINPGIIDLNTCFNSGVSFGDEETSDYDSAISEKSEGLYSETCENYEIGTKNAMAGGVTTLIETPSLLKKPDSFAEFSLKIQKLKTQKFFCDVGFLQHLHDENLEDIERLAEIGVAGFKAYLIPPAFEVPFLSINRLETVFRVLEKLKKPVFFHPEKANERYLYMSSPFRNENLARRKSMHEPHFLAFPGAFPEEIEGSGSEVSPISSSNSTPIHTTPLSARLTKVDEKMIERQIHIQSNTLETLIKAEIMTYSDSGFTLYEPESPIPSIPEISVFSGLKLSPCLQYSSPVKPVLLQDSKPRRPPPISCNKLLPPKENAEYKIFLANCPPHWEVNGIQAIVSELKKFPTCKVHIANVSSANAIQAVRKVKHNTHLVNFSCETSAFYLYFSEKDVKSGDTRFKASPPIREEKNRKLLIDMLSIDGIDVVSSYHRPIKPSLKFLTKGDFKRAVSGVDCIGLTLQAVWSAVMGNPKVFACKMAKVLSENPASVLGIENKGKIQVGKLADLVVWDPHSTEDLNVKNWLSPFVSEKLYGKVISTFLRGKIVYDGQNYLPCGRTI